MTPEEIKQAQAAARNRRRLTITIDFDRDRQPNWVWDSHGSLKEINGVIVCGIAEGDRICEDPELHEEEIEHDQMDHLR